MLVFTGLFIFSFANSVLGSCNETTYAPYGGLEEEGCNGDPNAIPDDCPSACPPTCDNLYTDRSRIPCPTVCDPSGCVCKPGFILTEVGGYCVLPEDCPTEGCNGDPNAIPDECPSACPPTCDNLYTDTTSMACPTVCDPSGCVCKPGYILTEKGGYCVLPEECPAKGCNGDPNAIPHDCPSACPPTCDDLYTDRTNIACPDVCDPSGCVCKPGYILTEVGGYCVLPEDCPAKHGHGRRRPFVTYNREWRRQEKRQKRY